jgi:hypothetical protein
VSLLHTGQRISSSALYSRPHEQVTKCIANLL